MANKSSIIHYLLETVVLLHIVLRFSRMIKNAFQIISY